MCDIARGLAFLHEKGFVHRDIAARNMLVQNLPDAPPLIGPKAKVGDFGQARKLPEGLDYAEFNEQVYDRNLAAPENYGIPGIHSKRSDVYQFGKVQWEAFTVNFDNFSKFFEEAVGLRGGLDLQQACTPTLNPNLTSDPFLGHPQAASHKARSAGPRGIR